MSPRNAIDPSTTSEHARYGAYTDAGVDWLDEIPAHWSTIRLNWAAEYINGYAFSPDERGNDGLPIIRIAQLNDEGAEFDYFDGSINSKYLVESGDLLFSWSATLDTYIWDRGPAWLNQHIFRVEPIDEVDRGYLGYCLKSVMPVLARSSHGSTMQHIKKSALKDYSISLPPLPEQRAIAAYLDRETERIDTLVEKKERLIELLEEKRTALISHAVTKGLDDDAEMKDSGVEWLGEIPAGWEVVKLKYGLKSIEQGWSPQCESRQASPDEWAVLKVGCVNGHAFDASEHKALPGDTAPKPKYQVNPGDVLMSRANTRELLGSAAVVDEHYPRLLLCDKLYRLTTNDEIDPELLVAQLSSRAVRHQLEQDATGASASMQNISQDTVQNLRLLIPPYSEQQRIAHYLNEQTSRYKRFIDRVRDGIDRLTEYRTALISAAVTGRIDVREMAATEETE